MYICGSQHTGCDCPVPTMQPTSAPDRFQLGKDQDFARILHELATAELHELADLAADGVRRESAAEAFWRTTAGYLRLAATSGNQQAVWQRFLRFIAKAEEALDREGWQVKVRDCGAADICDDIERAAQSGVRCHNGQTSRVSEQATRKHSSGSAFPTGQSAWPNVGRCANCGCGGWERRPPPPPPPAGPTGCRRHDPQEEL